MTMTVSQEIKGALQARTLTASLLPARGQISYEGRDFDPTTGVPYAVLTFIPTSGKPFSVDGSVRALRGLYQVSLFYPAFGSPGTSQVDAAADSVIAVFKSGTKLLCGSTTVIIDYAERATAIDVKDGWLHLPVTVGWRVFPVS